MSVPEYYQKAEDHQSILLLVRHLNDRSDQQLVTSSERRNDANHPNYSNPSNHPNNSNNSNHPINSNHSNKLDGLFDLLHNELVNVDVIKINGNLSYERTVRLRFKKNHYDLSNNEWGDFQAHRKLYGLITIGVLGELEAEDSAKIDRSDQSDSDSQEPASREDEGQVEEFYEKHKSFATNYSTLLDSRCLLLKVVNVSKQPNSNCESIAESKPDEEEEQQENGSQGDSTTGDSTDNELVKQNNLKNASLNDSNCNLSQDGNSLVNKLTNCNLYEVSYDREAGEFHALDRVIARMKQDLHDLVASLFYVLESKRLDKSYEKLEKIPLLLAPFENKSLVGLDTDSKPFKKKCLGRMRKHIGDLCLLVGSPSEALSNYSAAIDLLRPASDLLWLSAALEGQCVASLNLLYPNQPLSNLIDLEQENQKVLKKENSLKRIFSKAKFRSSGEPKSDLITAVNNGHPTENNNGGNGSNNGSNGSNNGTSSKQSTSSDPPSLTSIRSSKANLTKRFLSSTSTTPSNSNKNSANSLDPVMVKILGKSLLATDEEIYSRYKEACCHYAKFKMAAIVELECSLKATRVLAARDKFLQASEFIQNAAFITLESNPEKASNVEKNMEKTCVIGQLYEKIGFRRKSAFYQRLTALQTISSRIEKLDRSNWEKCYYLLLPSIFGYHLVLDPIAYEKRIAERDIGWTNIHLQLLQELVTMSRKMGNDQLAMRHLAFILQALSEYIPSQLKGDLARQLESLGTKCGEGAPVPLTLSNGYTISSVNLTKFPLVTKFDVQSLTEHLKPIKIKSKRRDSAASASVEKSPFIWTPIQRDKTQHNRRKPFVVGHIKNIDFHWVQNELCVVNIEVYNPLPIELKVNHMALMTGDTLAFETRPVSFSLPPESGPQLIRLTGKPLEAGNLEILGYTSHVLGCKNNCKLSELPYARRRKFPSKYVIEVIPSLPLLTCSIAETVPNDAVAEENPVDSGRPELSRLDVSKLDSKLDLMDGDSLSNRSAESSRQESAKANGESETSKTPSTTSQEPRKILRPVQNYPLKLYAGESKTVTLTIANSSANDDPIELINVKVISSLSKELEAKVLRFDLNEIQKRLPFASNSSIELSLKLYGAGDFITTIFSKENQDANSLTDQTKPAANATLSVGTPAHKKTQATLGSTLANFLSDLQSTPRHLAKQQTPTVKKVNSSPTSKFTNKKLQVTLEFEYTGAAGLTSGYCRQTRVNFLIEIMPSLLITKWDVLPAVQTSNCYLVFDALNATLNEMEVFYSSNKAIIIESKDTCRFPVPVERCPLVGETDEQNAKQNAKDALFGRQHNKAHSKSKESLIERIVRGHLTKQVQLSWKITQSNKQTIDGNASDAISQVPWTSKMINSISMCCIQFEVLLNGEQANAEQEFNHKLGELITIQVKLVNWSSSLLRSLTLMVECFQDFENGNRRYNLENKRGLMGSDRLYIEEIASKQSIDHQLEFVFFYTGVYKIDIRCIRNQFQNEFQTEKPDGLSSDSEWRFSPTLVLNIIE